MLDWEVTMRCGKRGTYAPERSPAAQCKCERIAAVTERTAADLQGVAPDKFEQLTFLLAYGENQEVVIVRNKDRGARRAAT